MTTSIANEGGILFHLNEYNDTDMLLDDIRGLSWNDQSDSIFSELRDARRKVFHTANGGRGDAANIIVLVTDGNSPEGYVGVEDAQVLKENVTVVVLAVDCSVPVREHLIAIASSPSDKHLIDVVNFDSIQNALGRLTKLLLFYSSDGILTHESYTSSKVADGMTTLALKTTNGVDVTPILTDADVTNETSIHITTDFLDVGNSSDDSGVTWNEPELSIPPPAATPKAVSDGRMGPYPGIITYIQSMPLDRQKCINLRWPLDI